MRYAIILLLPVLICGCLTTEAMNRINNNVDKIEKAKAEIDDLRAKMKSGEISVGEGLSGIATSSEAIVKAVSEINHDREQNNIPWYEVICGVVLTLFIRYRDKVPMLTRADYVSK